MAAQKRAHPRFELRHLEGLDQVVIRAGIEARYPILQGIACRHDENGQFGELAPHAAHQRKTAHARHHQIDDRQVVLFRHERVERQAAVSICVNLIA